MPPTRFPAGGADLWSPLTWPEDSFLNQRGSIALGAIARLRSGADVASASAEIATIAQRLAATYPETNAGRGAIVEPLQQAMVGPVRPMLLIIALSIAAVLVIACANVANLLLAQTRERGREFALRTSLGATRGRLTRQLLAESLALYAVAGVLGIAIAPALARALIARYPGTLPLAADVGLDGRVLLMAMAVTLLTALIAGVPRLRALGRPALAGDLAEGARGLVGRAQRRAASALLIAQVALSIVLLLGAGALLRTFLQLSAVATGLDAARVVTMRLTLPPTALATPGAHPAVPGRRPRSRRGATRRGTGGARDVPALRRRHVARRLRARRGGRLAPQSADGRLLHGQPRVPVDGGRADAAGPRSHARGRPRRRAGAGRQRDVRGAGVSRPVGGRQGDRVGEPHLDDRRRAPPMRAMARCGIRRIRTSTCRDRR